MCDDVDATVAELSAQGVEFVRDVTDEGFGAADGDPAARRR